jgi:GH15 family glucan-1,4-alpha-glucosidase
MPYGTIIHMRPESLRIQDYGIIGDCRAAALIGRNGSLDWLCWPQFDSPAIFAGVLDSERGGHWRISPVAPYRTERRYVGESNLLETTFHCPDGEAVLTDLMPVASEEYKRQTLVADHEILRQIQCLRGEMKFRFDFEPRANYGLERLQIRQKGGLGLQMEDSGGVYWLRSSCPLSPNGSGVHAEVYLHAGELAQFSLSHAEESPAVLPCMGEAAEQRIRIALEWWQRWAGRAQYDGPYREAVIRSALILKLLTYAPSGAIMAAPTTSLPERIGDGLNWDYRYCWLRDASLTNRVLLGLGYWDEAEAFLSWMLNATHLTHPRLRILYTAFGQNAPVERELSHLSGYRGSRPVRIGNGARDQLQLDVYGEVIDAAAQFAFHGRSFDRVTQKVLIDLGKYVTENWQRPDEGIWEPRDGRARHTYSRLLCWTALDRLLKLARQGAIENAPEELFALHREMVRRDIEENAWNESLGSYVQSYGRADLDASLLQLTWYGFEAADAPRMAGTYRAIDRELRAGPALLYRYKTSPPEGAFGICSFWDAEYLALGGGSLDQARCSFERLLSFRNDLGLLAEEIDPETGEALGNFPQAFTHVGLINAAISIHERKEGKRQLPHREEAAARPAR